MSKKASTDLLNELHATMAKLFLDKLNSGEASASELSVMRQFLRDNDVHASIGSADMSAIEQAMSTLKALPLDGEVPEEFKH